MWKIFIAFWGRPTENANLTKKNQIASNFIIYNLQLYSKKELQEEVLSQKINLPHLEDRLNIEWFDKKDPHVCRWLIVDMGLLGDFNQYIFLLELFFDHFFNPLFYIGRLWYQECKQKNTLSMWDDNFSTHADSKLLDFLSLFQHQFKYTRWNFPEITDRVNNKDIEKFRLLSCVSMYRQLKKKYSYSKDMFFWLWEMSDIAIILEWLFTKKTETEGIGWMLRKRIHALIWNDIPDIEEEIKYLYRYRSNYVHGNLYADIIKSFDYSKDVWFVQPTMPKYKAWKLQVNWEWENMFELSRRYMSILRRILIYYLYLDSIFSETRKAKYKNIIELLDKSLFDTDLKLQIETRLAEMKNLIVQSYP